MSSVLPDELHLLNTDRRYRDYVSSVEKALKNFENSSEWADLISSLNKLKKAIQAAPKYQYIPKRVSVSKRLAQCLHPALPSGVHLKALEVYTCLFQNMSVELLSRDIFLYANGLFPLLANAALNVKPVVLSIYETYFLPLGHRLRPCLQGLIVGLLPGLEEGSDFYQRTFNLLRNVCIAQSVLTEQKKKQLEVDTMNGLTAAEDKYFYTCLWAAIVSKSIIRFPAIQYILSNYEARKRSRKEEELDNEGLQNNESENNWYLIGNSVSLMVNGVCACLQDSNPLVQRSCLDLLCICLPLSTQHLSRSDKQQMLVVAVHVVLRRDMSLNRRIYSWLMGSTIQQQQKQHQQQQKERGGGNTNDENKNAELNEAVRRKLLD